jgi:hypothetical protein
MRICKEIMMQGDISKDLTEIESKWTMLMIVLFKIKAYDRQYYTRNWFKIFTLYLYIQELIVLNS